MRISNPLRSLKEMYMGKLMRWWKKRQSRDKYLKNKAKIGFISTLMEKYLPKKYKGLSKLSISLTLIGKFWKTHPEIFPNFQFSGAWAGLISGKLIHKNLMTFSFCKIWMNFPDIGLCHAPELIQYYSSTKCFVLDAFSRNPEISKLTVGWVFQRSVMTRKFANK